MRPQNFKGQYQKELGAGNNPNTGDLPRMVMLDPNTPGVCLSVSCWKPSAEELAEINKTGEVWVGVMASLKSPTQPPIWLLGIDPQKIGFIRVPEEDVKHLGGMPPPIL